MNNGEVGLCGVASTDVLGEDVEFIVPTGVEM